MKCTISIKKCKRHTSNSYSDDSSSSQDDLMGNTRNVCKRHNCNKQKIVYYPRLIKLPHVPKITFSDSSQGFESSKRPRKSFSWPYTEWDNCRTVGPRTVGWPSQQCDPHATVWNITTVVTRARYKATENQPLWASNPQQSVATVTLGNTSPMFQWGTCICSTYLTRLVSNSWHMLDGKLPP